MATSPETDTTHQLLKSLVKALDTKKADALCVLRVSAQSTITDFLVLATGNSEPHLRSLRVETEKVLDAAKVPIAGMDSGGYGSGWTVVDAYQVMVHFFTAEQRENYKLESLWKDAEAIDVAELLDEKKPAPAAKKTVKKTAVVKKTATKKAAVKKPVAKKPAAKKAVVAKTKTPVVKVAKKAVKKTVVKKTVKPVVTKKTARKAAKKTR